MMDMARMNTIINAIVERSNGYPSHGAIFCLIQMKANIAHKTPEKPRKSDPLMRYWQVLEKIPVKRTSNR